MFQADDAAYNGDSPAMPGDEQSARAAAFRAAALDGVRDLRSSHAAPVYALLSVSEQLAALTALLAGRG
jgi:hypothetical protein